MQCKHPHRLFIGGIPTAGKSYLARKIAQTCGGIHVSLDALREKIAQNPRFHRWTNFYLDRSELEYFTGSSRADRWHDLVLQSEGLWPAITQEIESYLEEENVVIFEGVNLLPHLMSKYATFSGVVLIGASIEQTLARIRDCPRWGSQPYLQFLEAEEFFVNQRVKYRAEARQYGYPVFENGDDAFQFLHGTTVGFDRICSAREPRSSGAGALRMDRP